MANVDSDVFQEIDADDDEEALIDPMLRIQGSSTTSTTTSRPTTSSGTSQSQLPSSETPDISDNEDEPPTETRAQKRHRLSSQAPPLKKAKTSRLGVMDKMAEGIASMAEAIGKSSLETVAKESADSTIEGQAQEKIQDEGCLTMEGQLLMLELLTNATLARTYLIIKKDELRAKWLKQQIVRYIATHGEGDIDTLWINWEDESQH
jgi:hypothetical protein